MTKEQLEILNKLAKRIDKFELIQYKIDCARKRVLQIQEKNIKYDRDELFDTYFELDYCEHFEAILCVLCGDIIVDRLKQTKQDIIKEHNELTKEFNSYRLSSNFYEIYSCL